MDLLFRFKRTLLVASLIERFIFNNKTCRNYFFNIYRAYANSGTISSPVNEHGGSMHV